MTKLLKHINNTDVAIEVLKIFYVKEKQVYKLKVRWWNIGNCHPPWDMCIEERITIPLAKMPEWQPYSSNSISGVQGELQDEAASVNTDDTPSKCSSTDA